MVCLGGFGHCFASTECVYNQLRKKTCMVTLNFVVTITVPHLSFIPVSQGMVEMKMRRQRQIVHPILQSTERLILFTTDRYC